MRVGTDCPSAQNPNILELFHLRAVVPFQPFLAENHYLKFRGADVDPSHFTLKTSQWEIEVRDQRGRKDILSCYGKIGMHPNYTTLTKVLTLINGQRRKTRLGCLQTLKPQLWGKRGGRNSVPHRRLPAGLISWTSASICCCFSRFCGQEWLALSCLETAGANVSNLQLPEACRSVKIRANILHIRSDT